MPEKRFMHWKNPEFDENGLTKWNWMCQNHENLVLEKNTDIGAFTYINAKFGVLIEEYVEIGSHCSIYSHSTIDNKQGKVIIKRNAKIGTHSVIMPGITIGENTIVGAFSYVIESLPKNVIAYGIPAKVMRNIDESENRKG
jgi:acetyltransferase-like isoleucine patch superfamily enzyme